MPGATRITVLAEKAFWKMYTPLCRGIPNASNAVKQQVQDELQMLAQKLKTALGEKWIHGKDYEIGLDWNPCWHHGMGIYSTSKELGFGQIFFHEGKIFGDGSEELDYGRFDSPDEDESRVQKART